MKAARDGGLIGRRTAAGLCERAFMQLLNREHHIPVLAPDDIAVLDRELLEVLWYDVPVVLGMRVRKDKRPEIHCL